MLRKNCFLLLFTLTLLVFSSCSTDDAPEPVDPDPDPVDISLVLNEVQYTSGDWLEIFNSGTSTADLSDYWLCLGPGTYVQIGTLTPLGGSITDLAAGEYLLLSYDMPDEQGGLGLYNSDAFTSSDALVDFVQWGAGGSAREDVAVGAEIWTAGEFVPTVLGTDNSIIFDGNGNNAADWAETTTVTPGAENILTAPVRSIVINEVQYGNRDLIEIYNDGDITVDLSTYWLCLGPGTYVQIGDITPENGTIELAGGEFLTLPYTMPDDQGGLGLYTTDEFTNPDALIDFVQWGAAGSAREDIAVMAGIWTAGDFVPPVRLNSFSIEYDGEGDTASDWTEEVNPSLGQPNDTAVQTTTFNVTIWNVTNYLNVHTFTTPVGATDPGPLGVNGAQYQVSFQAVPGTKFTPVTMMGNSNDWFLAPTDLAGIDLFPGGTALDGVDIANQLSLYDLGTEADNDPATFPPAGVDVGPADPNEMLRLVPGRGTGEIYMTAVLDYAGGDGSSAGTFTLTITAINAPDGGVAPGSNNGFVITPGIVVLHALPEPLFALGEADRGLGLERIAEDGMPGELFSWFTETGSDGSPLRLASSLSVFSPGLVYAFNTDSDPFFTQGEATNPESGLEQLAEDGMNAPAVDYIASLGLPVVASNETMNIGPGGSLNFTIEVPRDQNYKLGIGTMLVQTNDWYLAYNNVGYSLFDEDGNPAIGDDITDRMYLYDAGTEVDQAVGFGLDQAPRQSGPNTGAEDDNTLTRRVSAIDDVQFGKGIISSPAGVVGLGDERGGYNVISVIVSN